MLPRHHQHSAEANKDQTKADCKKPSALFLLGPRSQQKQPGVVGAEQRLGPAK